MPRTDHLTDLNNPFDYPAGEPYLGDPQGWQEFSEIQDAAIIDGIGPDMSQFLDSISQDIGNWHAS